MSSNRSILDTLNTGRQRRQNTSLEDLSRTLEDIESRFGRMQGSTHGRDEDDRRSRRLAGAFDREPQTTRAAPIERHPAEPATTSRTASDNADAIASLRREIERSRKQTVGTATISDLSAELRALREDMREQMSTGMRSEFDALRHEMERTSSQLRGDPDARQLTAEMERLSRAIQSMAERSDDRGLDMLRSEMEQVRESLADLAREETVRSMDDRWSRFEERTLARSESDPAMVALAERLEQIGEAISNLPDSMAMRSLEDKMRTLATAVDHFSRQAAEPAMSLEPIESRLDEISRAIVASSASAAEYHAEPFERIEARIAALAQQLDEMADGGNSPELMERLNALSRRVEDIAQQAALPEKAIERLGRQIAAVYDRLENESSGVERDRILDSLESRFGEIAALFEERHDRATAQGQAMMREMDRRLEELAERFDGRDQTGLGIDPAVLQALDEKFADLSERIDARSEAIDLRLLDQFEQRLNGIANRVDEAFRQASDIDPALLQAIDEKFADLTDRLGNRGASPADPALRAIEGRLEDLAQRLDDSARHTADIDPALIAGLERQLAGLTAHLSSGSVAEAPAFDVLSPRLDRIEKSLSGQRDAIVAAAQEAAQRAVTAMRSGGLDDEDAGALAEELRTLETLARKSDERNTRTFEAIHDTLLKVVDRLASLETRNPEGFAPRNRIEPESVPSMAPRTDDLPLATSALALSAADAVSRPAPQPRLQQNRSAAEAAAAAASAAVETPDAAEGTDAPKKSLLGGFARALSGRKEAKAERAQQVEPVMSATAEPTLDEPLDGAIADQPLEPGSGAPDLNAIMKRVRDGRTPPAGSGDTSAAGKADFIAAARRAAQAAAAEAQTFRHGGGDGSKQKFSPSEFLRAKRKPILMAAAAIMMALAGLQLGKAFFADDTRIADAPATEAPALVATAPIEEIEDAVELDTAAAAASSPVRSVDSDSRTAALDQEETDGPLADEQSMAEDGEDLAALDDGAEVSPEERMLFEPAPIEAGPIALREAADAGDPKAMFEIGNRYDAGRGVTADRAEAAKWYERAADQGFAPAQYRIGNFYEKGLGVERDVAQAKTWYQLAAAQGNASAMHNLAVLFAMGTDGPVDNESAARWFVKAAELGVKDSQYNLGILAAKGLGVPQSLEESYKWFALVAKTGDKDASAKRDEVAKALRPEQLAQARAAAELWKPKPLVEEANVVEIPDSWQESQGTTASIDMKKAVMTIQLILNKNGYDAGTADGIMGGKTKAAIASFQKDNGMEPTGEVNDELVQLLLSKK